MSELFPTFHRILSATGRGVRKPARWFGRVLRRTWKPILLAILVLNMLFTISNYFERRYIERFRVEPKWNSGRYNSSKNPYRHYEAAVRLISDEDFDLLKQWAEPDNSRFIGPVPTTEEANRALDRIQPAIEALQRGAACSGKDFGFASKRASVNEMFPEYPRLRDLAKYATLDASRKLERGQTKEGLEVVLSVVEIGNDIRRSGNLNGGLWGYAISRIGSKPLHEAIGSGRLTADELRMAARELQRINDERLSCRSMMDGMNRYEMAVVEEIVTSYHEATCECTYSPLTALCLSVPWMKARTLRNSQRVWLAVLEASARPYPEAMRLDVAGLIPRTDPVNWVMLPLCERVFGADAQDKALTSGLMLAAALEAHRLEHGSYPELLDALVGAYLKRIPSDPFTDEKPFAYSTDGTTYMLYSVGPNMKDEGGRAALLSALDRNKPGDLVFAPGVRLWKD